MDVNFGAKGFDDGQRVLNVRARFDEIAGLPLDIAEFLEGDGFVDPIAHSPEELERQIDVFQRLLLFA